MLKFLLLKKYFFNEKDKFKNKSFMVFNIVKIWIGVSLHFTGMLWYFGRQLKTYLPWKKCIFSSFYQNINFIQVKQNKYLY